MNKNLKGDILWAICILAWVVMLIIPTTRSIFVSFTSKFVYLGAFIKFAVLATMGDLLGKRIISGKWKIENGFIGKAVVWGLLGMAISLVYTVFTSGALHAQEIGKLPGYGSKFLQALLGSSIMNLTFGPMLYVYHSFGDLCVDHFVEKKNLSFNINEMISKIDWSRMVKFSWLTTCLFIWIPCHTIVFLLPTAYQVLVSAFLSIMLGILIALSKRSKPSLVKTSA